MRPDPLLVPVHVHEDLPLQQVEGLVHLRVQVERCHFALGHDILEQQEGAHGLSAGGLPRMHAPTVEPKLLTFALGAYNRHACVDSHPSLSNSLWYSCFFMKLSYHHERTV